MYKNQAGQYVVAQVLTSTGGLSTSGVSARVLLDGGTLSTSPAGTLAHEGSGLWSYSPSQAETNVDHLAVQFYSTSGGLPVTVQTYPTDLESTGPVQLSVADAVWDEPLTGASHNIVNSAGRRLRAIQAFGEYEGGAVWLNEGSGPSTGTTPGEDGTVSNRSNSISNALSLLAALAYDKLEVNSTNVVTLPSAVTNVLYSGHGSELNLNGQDISGSLFLEVDNVYGSATISTGGDRAYFRFCDFSTATIPPSRARWCGIGENDGTLTLDRTLAGTNRFNFLQCYSRENIDAVSIALSTGGAGGGPIGLSFRNYNGGLNISGIKSGDKLVLSGQLGVVTLAGSSGTVDLRGDYESLSSTGFTGTVIDATHESTGGYILADLRAIEGYELIGVGSTANPFRPTT